MPKRRMLWLTGLVMACLVPAAARGQVYNSAESVRSLYQRYLGREPSSNELTQWVWAFQKGLSLAEAQVTFLASDDFFVRQSRNATTYITSLYAEVLNRTPSQDEVTAWLASLNSYRGNREKLVRDFLTSAQQEIVQRAPLPPRPAQTPVVQAQDGQLSATARLLREALEGELGGTQQGRQLSLLSRNLVNASRSLEQALTASPDTYAPAYRDVHQTLSALEDEFQAVRFSAPHSSAYLDRFIRVFESVAGSPLQIVPAPPTAPTSVAGLPSMDTGLYNEVLRLNTALSGDTQQLLYVLRSMLSAEDYHEQLLRDVEFFYSVVDGFHHSLQANTPITAARSYVIRLRGLATGISQSMRLHVPAGGIVQRWDVVNWDLQQLGELVGVSTGSTIDPGLPVLFNAPTYSQLPYQVHRPLPTRPSPDMVPAINRAVAHLNAFVVGFNRFLPYDPQVPALQTQARTLRLSLLQLRQDVTGGGNRRRQRARLTEINQLLEALQSTRTRMGLRSHIANAPELTDVNASVQRVNQAFLAGYAVH